MRAMTAALASAAMACGSAHDLSLPAGSLVTIRGHVDLASIASRAAQHKLYAVLSWGAAPTISPLCHRHRDDTTIAAACPDPFGFFTSGSERPVPIDGARDGHFTIQLDHLPAAEFVVGTSERTFAAQGSIMIVADMNDDGLADPVGRSETRGVGPGPASDSTRVGSKPVYDSTLACSFFTLHEPSERVSLRVGDFEGFEHFYPATGCGELPTGFSIVRAPAYGSTASDCEIVAPASAVIEVRALSEAQSRALECRGAGERFAPASFGWLPASWLPDPFIAFPAETFEPPVCIDSNTLVLPAKTDECPWAIALLLSGCLSEDPSCETPDFDDRAHPPAWWPCAS